MDRLPVQSRFFHRKDQPISIIQFLVFHFSVDCIPHRVSQSHWQRTGGVKARTVLKPMAG